MEEAGPAAEAAAIAALARCADAIRLPPVVLPGWSSLCAGEYSALVVELGAHLAALRAGLETAARTAGTR